MLTMKMRTVNQIEDIEDLVADSEVKPVSMMLFVIRPYRMCQ
jgi:hypothetical protein